jgi:hypothetical protein
MCHPHSLFVKKKGKKGCFCTKANVHIYKQKRIVYTISERKTIFKIKRRPFKKTTITQKNTLTGSLFLLVHLFLPKGMKPIHANRGLMHEHQYMIKAKKKNASNNAGITLKTPRVCLKKRNTRPFIKVKLAGGRKIEHRRDPMGETMEINTDLRNYGRIAVPMRPDSIRILSRPFTC